MSDISENSDLLDIAKPGDELDSSQTIPKVMESGDEDACTVNVDSSDQTLPTGPYYSPMSVASPDRGANQDEQRGQSCLASQLDVSGDLQCAQPQSDLNPGHACKTENIEPIPIDNIEAGTFFHEYQLLVELFRTLPSGMFVSQVVRNYVSNEKDLEHTREMLFDTLKS